MAFQEQDAAWKEGSGPATVLDDSTSSVALVGICAYGRCVINNVSASTGAFGMILHLRDKRGKACNCRHVPGHDPSLG